MVVLLVLVCWLVWWWMVDIVLTLPSLFSDYYNDGMTIMTLLLGGWLCLSRLDCMSLFEQ